MFFSALEKTSFVAVNWVSERWVWETGMGSVSWPQNWYFLTFPKRFLAARGHSLRNPDAFRSSLPAYNPMGASRIVSAKKHSGKVSKCSALLYAFQINVLARPFSFRDRIR